MTAFTKSLSASLASTGTLVRNVPLLFRILAATADSGTDFLGNVYRSVVTQNAVSSVGPSEPGHWLSKPNPSHFGVESLYFDQRVNGQPVVIDGLTLSPITPGVYFNIYYSTDQDGPGTDDDTWDNLLWTPVYQIYQANRTQTYALPEPIVTKYVKIEFSRLQARAYNPGNFPLPTTFKKYPKWVLDYYVARFGLLEHDLLSSGADITYDALDLAYSYYRADILTNPSPPPLSLPDNPPQVQFFQEGDNATSVDPTTLAQIKLGFQPFLNQPALQGRTNTALGAYAASAATSSYSVEAISRAVADTTPVSNLQREPLLVEKGFPIMSFYIPCRHGYRVSQSSWERNVAYFAGVRHIVFHRAVYGQVADERQYNEVLADGTNAVINDFLSPLTPLP